MTQDVVNSRLNPRTIRFAAAYFDMEDDVNVAFRQSRLAAIVLEHILGEVRAVREMAERRGDTCTEYHLRNITRDLSGVLDAVTEFDAAAARMERRYYLEDAA